MVELRVVVALDATPEPITDHGVGLAVQPREEGALVGVVQRRASAAGRRIKADGAVA